MEHNYSIYPVIRSDKPNKHGLCPLYLRYTYKRAWKNIPLKKNIDPQFWNSVENEPRRNCPNNAEILNLIRSNRNQIESKILAFSREFGVYPNPDELLTILTEKSKNKRDWDYYFDEYVNQQKQNLHVEKSTIEIYNQLKIKLASFIKDNNIVWSWKSIDLNFYKQFVNYLRTIKLRNGKVGHTDSGIGKQIKTLKSFFNYVSVKYKFIDYNQFRNFKVLKNEPDFVVLTNKDLEIMKSALGISYVLKNKVELTDKEYQVLRTMLILCHTGMNISDLLELQVINIIKYNDLTKDDLTSEELKKLSLNQRTEIELEKIRSTNLFIKKNRKKLKNVNKKKIPIIPVTDELAMLLVLSFKGWKDSLKMANKLYHKDPFHKPENSSVFSLSKEIEKLKNMDLEQKSEFFEHYPFFLGGISEPVFNKEIKIVLKKIGLDYNEVIYQNTSDNKVKEVVVSKADLVTSRTGRRTYITSQISKNVNHSVIMRAVGISKTDTLRRYENISDNTIVEQIKKVNKTPQKLKK